MTCHFNTVKLPFPNKTLSEACLPPQISSHPSELWTAGAQNRSCMRDVRNKQKSHAYVRPISTHVFTPYVALMRMHACTTEMHADALPVKPLFLLTSPILIKNRRPSISPLPCTCKILAFSFLLLDDSICSRRCRDCWRVKKLLC